ncbi:hypothetical protein V8C40DRAFT_96811 [Trichoderma camerunense]
MRCQIIVRIHLMKHTIPILSQTLFFYTIISFFSLHFILFHFITLLIFLIEVLPIKCRQHILFLGPLVAHHKIIPFLCFLVSTPSFALSFYVENPLLLAIAEINKAGKKRLFFSLMMSPPLFRLTPTNTRLTA